MGVRSLLKRMIKQRLNTLGYDIIGCTPEDTGTPTNNANPEYVFEPAESKQYLWLSLLNIRTILDIGAHTGEFATLIHRAIPHARIISFEPLGEMFQQLVANTQDLPNFKAFNCALGEANAQVDMHRNEFTPSSSLLPMTNLHKEAFPFTKRETTETVQVRTLDKVGRELSLEDNILIKMDVQGYEEKVIRGGESMVSRAKVLIVETSFQTLYEGQPLFDDIYRLLGQKGFRYTGNLEQLRSPTDGSVLQADAIFIKN